jgi:O-antigen/teichoic acid export membrane protein
VIARDYLLRGRSKIGPIVAGTVAGQAAVLASSPILTRIYTPSDFGALAVFAALLAMGLVLATWKNDVRVINGRSARLARSVVASGLVAAWITGAVVTAAALAWPDAVASWLGAPALAPYLWLVGLGMIVGGSYRMLSVWLIRTGRFLAYGRTLRAQGVTQAASQVAFGLFGTGLFGLLLGYVAGAGGGLILSCKWWLRDHGREQFRRVKRSTRIGLRLILRGQGRYLFYSTPAGVLERAAAQAPALLVAAFWGPVTAGLYAITIRVVDRPSSMVALAVSAVFQQKLGSASAADGWLLFRRTAVACGLLAGVMLVATVAFAPAVAGFAFGHGWREAGVYAQILAPAVAMQFVLRPVQDALDIMEMQRVQFLSQLLITACVISSLTGAYMLDSSPRVAIAALSMAIVASAGMKLLLIGWITYRRRVV